MIYLFMLLRILDVFTTYLIVSGSSYLLELNPLSCFLIKSLGINYFSLLNLLASFIVILFFLRFKNKLMIFALRLFMVINLFIVLSNSVLLFT